MLKFDARTTRLLDHCYLGADITRRRQASFGRLRPAPAETIIDIGCGNGLLSLELGRAVGEGGTILGVDPSADMRKSAIERCKGMAQVRIVEGTANDLPIEDGQADKAVSVQVFEYLSDVPGAAREAFRALKPGGRLVIGDIHFDTLVWFSDHPERMQRVIQAWESHAPENRLPAILPAMLREAGFSVDAVDPVTVCDTVLRPDGLAIMMMQLMKPHAVATGALTAAEGEEWMREQEALARAGRFFFSVTHFVTSARKPEA